MTKPIDALGRLGTETAFEVLARAQQLAAEGQDIINLGIGQPDFRTPDHIVRRQSPHSIAAHMAIRRQPGFPGFERPLPQT